MPSCKLFTFLALASVAALELHAQPKDPGIRSGPPGAGRPIDGLTAGELDYFTHHALPEFAQVEDVADGLGPRFNLDSCGGCHAFPALGGSSPPANNPQVVNALAIAPGNTVPAFLAIDGPVREVRFKANPDGTADGGVHAIFTIAGRSDKPPGCMIAQPNFSNSSNMVFRIPTPTFGAGLIEAIPDRAIRNNLRDSSGRKQSLGIQGHANTNGNDGTVTRFGWKAQNKSLLIFSGEAYNVEMGVTNESFPNEREENPRCAKVAGPQSASTFSVGAAEPPDIVAFMAFMKFLDQPDPSCSGTECSVSVQNGHRLFSSIGCSLCHTESLTTGQSATAALSNKTVRLFSDLAVHGMGSELADGIVQGAAGPDEFRTAPLWGVGQRAFFLHDGRTNDLLQAILAHASPESEAGKVISAFQSLSDSQQQDILNFLRSL
jgi:CxxC motif-containing protein (DUF1111 family)